MRNAIRGLAVLTLAILLGGRAAASTDELSFRILGWYGGKADISTDQIKCEIPTTADSIADSNFAVGLWNTFGSQTLMFPDDNNPFGNPCGGWLQFANFLQFEGVTVERVIMKVSIPGARRFQNMVPTARSFPTACRSMRKYVQYVGNRMDPASAVDGHSGSGASNVVFIKMQPMIGTDLIHCLRSQYAPLSTDVFTYLPVRVQATAVGVTDSGQHYRSNTVNYTVNFRHTCGNGRVDDGEECDPVVTPICQRNLCNLVTGHCSNDAALPCSTDDECAEICMPQGDPSECVCLPAQR